MTDEAAQIAQPVNVSPAAASYVACDLGAESGRVILGTLAEGKLTLEEIYRFPNGGVTIRGTLRWNILRIFEELKIGLRKVSGKRAAPLSLSVDSWGVDYVLCNETQPILSLPYHYRDARTDRTFERTVNSLGAKEIFAATGIQFMAINTIYQLVADLEENAPVLSVVTRFLTIADFIQYLFSGAACIERSLASTTQLYDPRAAEWAHGLIEKLQLPPGIFPPIVAPGTKLGPLLEDIAAETGLSEIEVIASCSHDTAAAVAAVPALEDGWAFLSSGTWSLIGVELPEPLMNEEVRACGFTNEAGFAGTTRFLKNIVGLWLLQESRRAWALEGKAIDYGELTRDAASAEPLRSMINPNAARFLKPGNMPAKIAAYCRETGQTEPESPGQFARCILESLALLYERALHDLERLTGLTIARLHIVGGGSQSKLLNQAAADATGRAVLAGPIEATAIGNLLIQAITLGHLDSHSALRKVVANSFQIENYQPRKSAMWHDASTRFAALHLAT